MFIKNIKLQHIFLSFLFLFFFFSCSDNNCLKSKGEIKSETRLLNSFKKIEINDLFNIYLVNDSIEKIEIETNENILNNVLTNVEDSVLVLNNTTKCRFLKENNKFPNLTIHIKYLNFIEINEACNIYTIDTLKINRFLIRNIGNIGFADLNIETNHFFFELWETSTGKYFIKGKTTYFTTTSYGNSYIFADNFFSKYTSVKSNSTGDYYLNCTEKIVGEIKSSGDVFLFGNPITININEESSGKLILK